jgi:hypothetical protein
MMLRYAPVAACLALILLALPWITDTLRRPDFDSGTSAPAATNSKFTLDADEMDTGEYSRLMENVMAETEGGDSYDSINGAPSAAYATPAIDATTPAYTELPPPIAPPSSLHSSSADNGAGNNTDSVASNDANNKTDNDISSDVAADYPLKPTATPLPAPEVLYTYVEEAPEPDVEDQLQPEWAGGVLVGQADQAPGNIMSFLNNYADAYAWIEITGELPGFMSKYEPVSLEGQLNWEMYYNIPRSAAKELIKEMGSRDDVAVTYNYEDGTYAIVLYSTL